MKRKVLGNISTVADGATPKLIGSMQLKWMDDEGVNHKHTMEDAFYAPDSPANLI